jgi:hypothetical protein
MKACLQIMYPDVCFPGMKQVWRDLSVMLGPPRFCGRLLGEKTGPLSLRERAP